MKNYSKTLLSYLHFVIGSIILYYIVEIIGGAFSLVLIENELIGENYKLRFSTIISVILFIPLTYFLFNYYKLRFDKSFFLIDGKKLYLAVLYAALLALIAILILIILTENKIDYQRIDIISHIYLWPYVFLWALQEEYLYRYLLLQDKFKTMVSVKVMVVISSLFFTLAHFLDGNFNFIRFFDLFTAGILFSLLYLKYKNFWMLVIFHMVSNIFGFIIIGINKGSVLIPPSLLPDQNYFSDDSIYNLIFSASLIATCILLSGIYWREISKMVSKILFKQNRQIV